MEQSIKKKRMIAISSKKLALSAYLYMVIPMAKGLAGNWVVRNIIVRIILSDYKKVSGRRIFLY